MSLSQPFIAKPDHSFKVKKFDLNNMITSTPIINYPISPISIDHQIKHTKTTHFHYQTPISEPSFDFIDDINVDEIEIDLYN